MKAQKFTITCMNNVDHVICKLYIRIKEILYEELLVFVDTVKSKIVFSC